MAKTLNPFLLLLWSSTYAIWSVWNKQMLLRTQILNITFKDVREEKDKRAKDSDGAGRQELHLNV